jgi:hypothetical protein
MIQSENDYEFLVALSGANGGLTTFAQACREATVNMTKAMDRDMGPDWTDAWDASCNTCAHFQREKFDRKERNPTLWGFPGCCAKTGDSVTGWPRGQFLGHACYENRRTGSPRLSTSPGLPEGAHFEVPR